MGLMVPLEACSGAAHLLKILDPLSLDPDWAQQATPFGKSICVLFKICQGRPDF